MKSPAVTRGGEPMGVVPCLVLRAVAVFGTALVPGDRIRLPRDTARELQVVGYVKLIEAEPREDRPA